MGILDKINELMSMILSIPSENPAWGIFILILIYPLLYFIKIIFQKTLSNLKGEEQSINTLFNTSSFKSNVGKALDIALNKSSYKLLQFQEINGAAIKRLEKNIEKHQKVIQSLDEETLKKEEKKSLVLTSLIVKHTSKSNTVAYGYLFSSLIIYLMSTHLGILDKENLIFFSIIVMILIVFIRQQILVYRIKQGKYGSNKYEIREILTFIFDETNKHYFNNNGGNQIIVNDITAQDLNEIKSSIKGFNYGGAKEI